MKQLPNNLKNLTLGISGCNIGKNPENMNWLKEGMKYLPNHLNHLELQLRDNRLGEITQNLKYLGQTIK